MLLSTVLGSLGLVPSSFKPFPNIQAVGNPFDIQNWANGPLSVANVPSSVGNAQAALTQADISNCVVEPYVVAPIVPLAFAPFDEAKATVYRYRQQQSVNLGSWFVLEQWMTPSLFTCAAGSRRSEIDVATGWGTPLAARMLLERHWDTFITEDDFKYLASIGINTVRIPIGYWTLGPLYSLGTPYESAGDVYQGAWNRVLRAIHWASEVGIGVLIDLHGAPGSQNGQDHSGISDQATNLFSNPTNIQKTIEVLTFLAQQLIPVTNVVGIQILNEPQNVPELTNFYDQVISTLRHVSPQAQSFPFYIHDGFDLTRFSDYVSNRKDFVVQDHHSYFVFTPEDSSKPAASHTAEIRATVSDQLLRASQKQRGNLVIDEWSCALTSNSLYNEADPVAARKAFCTSQMEVYRNTSAGWSFWSYKKEGCANDDGWCFRQAVGRSLPSTFFSYARDAPHAAEVANSSTATPTNSAVPSAIGTQLPPLSAFLPRRSDSTPQEIPPAHRRRFTHDIRHRQAAIFHRRAKREAPPYVAASDEHIFLSPIQRSTQRGYSDGFLTAKIFAQHDMSKLGFKGQYTEDSISKHGPSVIEAGTEQYYRDWFMKGLSDGEQAVSKES